MPGHFDSRLGAADFAEIFRDFFLGLRRSERFLGLRQGLLCSRHIDFIGALHGFGKNRNFVRKNFRKPPRSGKTMQLPARAITDLASAKFGYQWRMPWQDTDVAVKPGNLHFLRSVAHHQLLRRDNFELERVGHRNVGLVR